MGRKKVNKLHQNETKYKHNLNGDNENVLRKNVEKLLQLSTTIDNVNITESLKNQQEIFKIINEINTLEECRDKIETGDRYDKNTIDSFLNWFKDNGGIFQGCSVKKFENFDLGLVAEEDIPFGTLFIAVPKRLMISVDSASQIIQKKLCEEDQMLKNMPNVALAIYLLLEKYTGNSFYKPYLDILPKDYNTVLYFNQEELEELKGSPTLDSALRLNKNIARQYAYFYFYFRNSDDSTSKLLRQYFTYKEYRWAVSTVMTRQNAIPGDDGITTNTLIPLWDLCNHTNGTISTDYNPDLKRSECLALKDFKSGEQLFIFYGPRTNAELFIHNGFVFDNNEHDCYYLRLGVSKADKLQNKRLELLEKLSLGRSNEFCLMRNHHTLNVKLLAFARIFNMEEDCLNEWLQKDVAVLEEEGTTLDANLEKKTYLFLKGRLNLLLLAYSSSLAEDEEIINKSGLSANKILAVKMRMSEKNIILDNLNHLEKLFQKKL